MREKSLKFFYKTYQYNFLFKSFLIYQIIGNALISNNKVYNHNNIKRIDEVLYGIGL